MSIFSLARFWGLALLTLALWSSPLLAKSSSREDLFSRLTWAQASQARDALNPSPAAGEGPPVVVAVIPAYHHTHHQSLKTTLDGTRLKSRSGTSRLGSLTLTATKPLSEFITLGWIYQYTFGQYKGGLLVPDLSYLDGRSEVDLSSHMTGLFGDFALGAFGNLNASFLVAWDSFSGRETMISPAGPATRNLESQDTRLGSITLWWRKAVPLSQSWSLSPFLGWRTIRACLRGQTDWTGPVGATTTLNSWAHLVSGGLTLKYQGPVSLTLWAGHNQRTKKGNIPGFSSRAIAPDIANLGWMNNWDQRVWTYGLGLGKSFGDNLNLDLSYNGFQGKDALSQTVNLAVIWVF
ncbi:MAG: hypothetical protein LBR11_11895 [Deltaproteobacteria bacterium]|jgi:opacity protein-like surface antigen|nr:hypothetical protein [Deltaproteobacteria bacterium]